MMTHHLKNNILLYLGCFLTTLHQSDASVMTLHRGNLASVPHLPHALVGDEGQVAGHTRVRGELEVEQGRLHSDICSYAPESGTRHGEGQGRRSAMFLPATRPSPTPGEGAVGRCAVFRGKLKWDMIFLTSTTACVLAARLMGL